MFDGRTILCQSSEQAWTNVSHRVEVHHIIALLVFIFLVVSFASWKVNCTSNEVSTPSGGRRVLTSIEAKLPFEYSLRPPDR